MRSIQWKVAISDEDKIMSMENAVGLPVDKVESHLLIIGVLENLKQKHLDQLNTLFQKTVKKGQDGKYEDN